MFQKKASQEEDVTPENERRFTDRIEQPSTVIGAGIVIKGELQGQDNIELYGTVEGESNLQGTIFVRKGGTFLGDIKAGSVLVEGTIKGNISASEKIELRHNAHMTGNLAAGSIAIAEGSYFQGEVSMGGKTNEKPFVYSEKRQSTGGEASNTSKNS